MKMIEDSGSSLLTPDVDDVKNARLPIFGVLRVDICARAILKYVPIRDLVRSESVSKEWQRAVHYYLENYCSIELVCGVSDDINIYEHRCILFPGYRFVYRPRYDPNTIKIIEKLQSCVKKVSLCYFKYPQQVLKTIATKCVSMWHVEISLNLKGFQYFLNLMQSNNLTSLEIYLDDSWDGHVFLSAMRNLNSLGNITSLKLNYYPIQFLKDILHLLFMGMPKLEKLTLECYDQEDFVPNEFIESISRLSELKRLSIRNGGVNDAFLEALAQGCRKLEYLGIEGFRLDCVDRGGLTPRGLSALCRRSSSAATTLQFCYWNAPDRIQVDEFTINKPLCQELERLCCVTLTTEHLKAACLRAILGDITLVLKSSCNAVDAQDPRHELKIILYDVFINLIERRDIRH